MCLLQQASTSWNATGLCRWPYRGIEVRMSASVYWCAAKYLFGRWRRHLDTVSPHHIHIHFLKATAVAFAEKEYIVAWRFALNFSTLECVYVQMYVCVYMLYVHRMDGWLDGQHNCAANRPNKRMDKQINDWTNAQKDRRTDVVQANGQIARRSNQCTVFCICLKSVQIITNEGAGGLSSAPSLIITKR